MMPERIATESTTVDSHSTDGSPHDDDDDDDDDDDQQQQQQQQDDQALDHDDDDHDSDHNDHDDDDMEEIAVGVSSSNSNTVSSRGRDEERRESVVSVVSVAPSSSESTGPFLSAFTPVMLTAAPTIQSPPSSASSLALPLVPVATTTTPMTMTATKRSSSRRSQADASFLIKMIRCFLVFIIVSLFLVLILILVQGDDPYTGILDDYESSSSSSSSSSWQSVYNNSTASTKRRHQRPFLTVPESNDDIKKILYIVTSSAEYNNMRRPHMRHHHPDRLQTQMIPVLLESIESIMESGFQVDLYLIVSYTLTSERHDMIASALPPGVGLEVWNDATPIDYDDGYRDRPPPTKVKEINRALSRQHRYVVKEKLFDYDLFCAFEDDMLITGTHILHHLWMSRQLNQYAKDAKEHVPRQKQPPYHSDGSGMIHGSTSTTADLWFGDMEKKQFPHMRPGFIRVEVILNETDTPTQSKEDIENVNLDYNFSDLGYHNNEKDHDDEQWIDPSICCHVHHVGAGAVGAVGAHSNGTTATTAPMKPTSSKLMVWETGISGLGVREMPDGSWYVMLPGPRQFLQDNYDYKVGVYRTTDMYFSSSSKEPQLRPLKVRPNGSNPKFLAQSAGWIMTRGQVLEMHTDLCKGSFLPPFDTPTFHKDGLYMMNVEYWSGGVQMWCPMNGCNIQRVMDLDPKNFSKHLLYHTSNNKQKQITPSRRVKVNHLIGQLNTIRKDAMMAKQEYIKILNTKKTTRAGASAAAAVAAAVEKMKKKVIRTTV